ncbi:MAG: ACT domain-containing protein [Clostridiales bacterium]|nr:ACT domain-containing protein [Clostridiales bacterium]
MIIQQLSVFLENRSGRLTEVTEILANNKINISALSIAETADYGVLRMIVDNPEKAIQALKKNDLSVHKTDVIAIITPDTPGALHQVIKHLSEEDINVAYMYGYSHENKASIIMKVNEPNKAIRILQDKKVELLSAGNFYEV